MLTRRSVIMASLIPHISCGAIRLKMFDTNIHVPHSTQCNKLNRRVNPWTALSSGQNSTLNEKEWEICRNRREEKIHSGLSAFLQTLSGAALSPEYHSAPEKMLSRGATLAHVGACTGIAMAKSLQNKAHHIIKNVMCWKLVCWSKLPLTLRLHSAETSDRDTIHHVRRPSTWDWS